MIAKIKIEKGRFVGGYVRGADDRLLIHSSNISWPHKWHVTMTEDLIRAVSTRTTTKGVNTVKYTITSQGRARLELISGEKVRLIRDERVFSHTKNFDGDLFLIYNAGGYRSAYFYSKEFNEWKTERNLINVVSKDPNLMLREKMNTDNHSRLAKINGLSLYNSGKLTVITDGNITIEEQDYRDNIAKFACIDKANWAILEKQRKKGVERVLITKKSIFDLDVPTLAQERMSRASTLEARLMPARPVCTG